MNREFQLKKNINTGQIKFINCLPINYCFEKWNIKNLKIYNTYPTRINTLMNAGKLDIAPVSSVEYLKNPDKYKLLSNICISSNDFVRSVLLFSKNEIKNLENCNIAIPFNSATSIIMLKIILQNYGINLQNCNFITHDNQNTLQESLSNNLDAILYIGDKALQENISENNFYIYDIGHEWKQLTAMPAVFGIWVTRQAWYEENLQEFNYLKELFSKAIDMGLNLYLNDIVDIATNKGFSEDLIKKYLTKNIMYNYTNEHRESLKILNKLALELKL